MGIQCGIVGLPNVGKSTLFNALTQAGIDAANFPFCTIEPNTGVVTIPDPRLNALAQIVKPQRVLATTMEFVDIAGLVAGASKGEGLGNQFLATIRETDAIAHVVRCFADDNIIHVANHVNPAADIETINTELALADLATVEKSLQRISRTAKSGDKLAVLQKNLFEKILAHLDTGKPARLLANTLTKDEEREIKPLCLLTMKPVLYVANVDENGFENNPYLDQLRTIAEAEQAEIVVICAKIESEIAELDDVEKQEFLTELGFKEPGLNRVIRAAYQLLGLRTFFTAGVQEVRAWTFTKNATAPEAAGVIHTDFQRGFIRAEITAYDDYIAHNGESGAKEAGKWRLEGKEYKVQDGDVIHFRFNV